jgi:hypothetical protein
MKLGYEKTYMVMGTRLESKDIAVVELLDENSSPNAVKTIVVRMGPSDYAASLANAPIGSKVKVALSIVEVVAPPQT